MFNTGVPLRDFGKLDASAMVRGHAAEEKMGERDDVETAEVAQV